MKNRATFISALLVVILASIFSSCTSYNKINFRKEKQIISEPNKKVELTELAEKSIINDSAMSNSNSNSLETREVLDQEIINKDENQITQQVKKSFFSTIGENTGIKDSKKVFMDKVLKVQPTKTLDEITDESSAKALHTFNNFHLIIVGLTVLVALLMAIAFIMLFGGVGGSIVAITYICAVSLFLVGYTLLIFQNFVLPKRINDSDKDKWFLRKKTFAKLTFIMACIPLGFLLMYLIGFLIAFGLFY
jgi:hypothetical protein